MIIRNNLQLERYNSYSLRAIARSAYIPESVDDLKKLLSDLNDFHLIGAGNNIILANEYYERPFIIIGEGMGQVLSDDCALIVESGASLKVCAETALSLGLSGLENFLDVPSSMGGALVMNAGANGDNIGDLVEWVECYNSISGEIELYSSEQCLFGFRKSCFQYNSTLVILRCKLLLKHGIRRNIREKMMDYKAARWKKQPRDLPNAGSVFKRPSDMYVGTTIEQLGLKGLKLGGAQISERHAGFIVNIGDAKGTDILGLITIINYEVQKTFGRSFEVEQRIIRE